jgi:CxxH/CxxC protein (TIGR04129 family)
MEEKNKYCCKVHIDMAFDDFLLETETFPFMENTSDKKCSYCNDEANYVLRKPQNEISSDTI